jgi:DNA polymerase-3 subunit gamma/tau
MTYTALARKWRPRRFEELTGQEHVVRALSSALTSGRVHHAFLFTGTRGVGKTTIARIFAKCLNCEAGVSPSPCGTCASCREIDDGRFVDLIEVDAASRTKIDDTRELLDNVQYAPTRGRYKVYLIDEVHMLSAHSFNALLKTLEEPPPHVKFLLATTDPQKLPVTVLSRCLQFNLKRIPMARIAERMRTILATEGVEAEAPALQLVARAADGSLRDALSLLDQLIAFGQGRVDEKGAAEMLGTIDRQHPQRIAEALASGDAGTVMALVEEIEDFAPDHAQLLDALTSLFARVALRQAVPGYEGDELHAPLVLERLAAALSPEDVQLFYQTAILGRRDLEWAPDPRTGLEMTLLRMLAFRPAGEPVTAPGAGDASGARAGAASAASTASSPGAARLPRGEGAAVAPGTAGERGVEPSPENWAVVVAALGLGGPSRQLAAHCAFVRRDGATIHLVLDPRGQHLRTAALTEKLATALGRYLGSAVRLEIDVAGLDPPDTPAAADERAATAEIERARDSIDSDPTVRALKQRFGATVSGDSVRPRR